MDAPVNGLVDAPPATPVYASVDTPVDTPPNGNFGTPPTCSTVATFEDCVDILSIGSGDTIPVEDGVVARPGDSVVSFGRGDCMVTRFGVSVECCRLSCRLLHSPFTDVTTPRSSTGTVRALDNSSASSRCNCRAILSSRASHFSRSAATARKHSSSIRSCARSTSAWSLSVIIGKPAAKSQGLLNLQRQRRAEILRPVKS